MRIAIISDIHSNLPALKAVLRDVSQSEIDAIYSLGDVVGYGSKPSECVDLLRAIRCQGVMGNHDFYACSGSPAVKAALAEPDSVGNSVWDGIRHTINELDQSQMQWLSELEKILHLNGAILAHAALHDFAEWPYLDSPEEAKPTLDLLDGRIGFFGHTHKEAIFLSESSPEPTPIGDGIVHLPESVSIAVTVGSVGKPRGTDQRAHWLLWDPENRTIQFRRST